MTPPMVKLTNATSGTAVGKPAVRVINGIAIKPKPKPNVDLVNVAIKRMKLTIISWVSMNMSPLLNMIDLGKLKSRGDSCR